jgi:hypothetical protein
MSNIPALCDDAFDDDPGTLVHVKGSHTYCQDCVEYLEIRPDATYNLEAQTQYSPVDLDDIYPEGLYCDECETELITPKQLDQRTWDEID